MADQYSDTPPSEEKPAPVKKARKSTGKMTDLQKAQLNKHMAQMKKKGDMSTSDLRRHRMQMID